MFRNKNILAIIPARSGSKTISHKNIRNVAGKPLLYWSINEALNSKFIDKVIVSTDSSQYADIAKKYGAEVPFIRPKEISQDNSTDLEVFSHTLEWLKTEMSYIPDYCVHLRPTNPLRFNGLIDKVIEKLVINSDFDSIRTVVETPHTPYKMWTKDIDNRLSPLINDDLIKEAYNKPRQILPKVYLQTANVDVVKTEVIIKKHSMTGDKIMCFEENKFYDIDTIEELESVINIMTGESIKSTHIQNETICFDIDGIIATLTPNNEYEKAECNLDVKSIISELKELGFKIVLYTARGSKTGIDWNELTSRQLREWGIEYDELHFGKPAALYYVDDRFITLSNLDKLVKNLKDKRND